MFVKSQMELINKFTESYDNHETTAPTNTNKAPEDITDLLSKLAEHGGGDGEKNTPNILPPLPPLYLASILYYSPSHWSVWVNDKKLISAYNTPGKEFYVSRLSRKEVELVWKPISLQGIPLLWAQYTNGGKNPLPDIKVDTNKGTVTLLLHPNQTFIPTSLSIHEGLVEPDLSLAPIAPKEQKPAPASPAHAPSPAKSSPAAAEAPVTPAMGPVNPKYGPVH